MGEVDANINQVTVLHGRILLEFRVMMNMDEGMDHRPMSWVGDWSGRRRALTPERTALIDPGSGRRLTYQQLDDRARLWARWMRDEAGLDGGDTVVLITRNRLEAVELFLAAGKIGVIIAPVSHRLTAGEATALVDRLDPAWLVVDEALADFAATLEGRAQQRPWLRFGAASGPAEQALARQRSEPVNRPLALADPCLRVHTGGSTGLPKICEVSHRQMVWNAVELMVAADGALARRRELVLFPLFHIGGWNTVLPILYAGGCVVMPDAFDPPAVLRAIDEQRINHFGAVEAMLQALAASPGFADHPLTSLEAITTAGAACSESSMTPFLERGITVRQSYGLTEAGPSNFVNADGRADEMTATDRASIGTAFFHTDYRIVDPERLTPLAVDTPGELQLRSPHDFDGYLDDPAATAARWTPDGWIRSGDLAREDAAGRVFIVGRMDNVIVSGGENIAAEEVESTLLQHPAVTAALVFGVPDPHWGARPVAWVTGPGRVPTDEVGEWLHGRLARFKHPALIEAVGELPRTGAGKLDRQAARHQYDQQTPGALS
ncbi:MULTISPECIES: class I adenylate-forming enzyme family protein [Spiribacter]|uniref:class I adenylate-forming enzyme family protein n=1 Tax=Spiribacter TaxID=1335745 RepID=UPI001F469CB9|nr:MULTISPECIES: AMP-binding protein [Spiribacter]